MDSRESDWLFERRHTRKSPGTAPSGAVVSSVDRALSLLELLASAPLGMNLSTISQKLRIPKSSAYYLVTTLAKRNMVRRNPDRRNYSLGIQASPFTEVSRAEEDIRTLCSPYIRSLSKALGMTAQTGIREGAEARIIDRSEMPGLRLDSWVGRHFDLHCTAVRKALIAYLSDVDLENLFRTRGFPQHNRNTVCSLEALKSQLLETRARGFSTDDEEHELGVRCVAAPVFNHSGGVAAAICVFGPASRLSRLDMPNLGLKVAAVTREISRALTGIPLPGPSVS